MWSVAGPYRDYLPTNTAIIFVCVMGGGHSVSIYRFVLPFSELVMTGSRGLLFKIGDEHNLTNVGFLVTL